MAVPSARSQISRLVCVSMDRVTRKDLDRSRGDGREGLKGALSLGDLTALPTTFQSSDRAYSVLSTAA